MTPYSKKIELSMALGAPEHSQTLSGPVTP